MQVLATPEGAGISSRAQLSLQPSIIVVDHLLPDATSDEPVPCPGQFAPDARVLLIFGLPERESAPAAQVVGGDGHSTPRAIALRISSSSARKRSG